MPTILVVDDVSDACQLLARLFRGHGYDTICVTTGEEALATVDADRPDLMLLDLSMPGMDGFEVLEALQCRPRERRPPVVMLTAIGDQQSMKRAKALGARDYFVKASFDVGEMLERISQYTA